MKKFIKNYYYILLPICITVFMMLVCGLYYSEVDDLFFNEIAVSSAKGRENLVCINVIYGYILKGLSTLIPSINWMPIIYLTVINISMIVLYKIVKENGNQIFAIGTLMTVQVYILFKITFTYIAFLCCYTAVVSGWHKIKVPSKNS